MRALENRDGLKRQQGTSQVIVINPSITSGRPQQKKDPGDRPVQKKWVGKAPKPTRTQVRSLQPHPSMADGQLQASCQWKTQKSRYLQIGAHKTFETQKPHKKINYDEEENFCK